MCGISAFVTNIFNYRDEYIDIIKKMNTSLSHRGPDFQDYWLEEKKGICFGHTRLSIQDLTTNGNQPMHSQNKRFVMCFNGEIYNHFKIREKIEKNINSSFEWKGTSDTETLLKSIEVFGFEKTLSLINGMFAICLYDKKKEKLYLSIDRFGEKPLYFGYINNSFVIGSELKVFKKFKDFNNSIDRESLDDFLRYSCVRAPKTIYKNIFKLEQGSMLEITLDDIFKNIFDNNLINHKFYKFWWKSKNTIIDSRDKKFKDYEYAKTIVEDTLSDSVRSQLISDVPLGSFLSGGIDSSLITALMCNESINKVKTFTIGFNDNAYDESKYAKKISKILGTEHYDTILSPHETLSIIPNLASIYDEPFADSSQLPTILLSQFAVKNVKVALSGDGGDELFGGYNRYFWINKIWKYFSWMPFPLRKKIGLILSKASPEQINHFYYYFSKNKNIDKFVGEKAIKTFQRLKYVENIDDLFISLTTEWNWNDQLVLDYKNKKINLYSDFEELRSFNYEDRMMYWDTANYLPNDILCKIDRAAMSKSLETRAPFLNESVFNASSRLPLKMKIKNNKGKIILRDILNKYIPRDLIDRPKQGFGIPLSSWLRNDLNDWAESLLEPRNIKKQGFLRNDIIQNCWSSHKSKRFDFHAKLWPILMFQSWMENN